MDSVYQFGENWLFHDTESSTFEHSILLHIFGPSLMYFHKILYFMNQLILRNFIFLMAIVSFTLYFLLVAVA